MTFVLPFLLAFAVGAIGITRQAWRDEHATWWAATIPTGELGDLLSRVDIVLAPYYLLMRGWVAVFGDSVVALRFPSLIAMAVAAGLTGVLGTRLYGRWVGLTAGALLALVPSVSRYAEEARPYALAVCFAVATFLALHARRWVLLALLVIITGLAHLVALTVLLAHLPLVLPTRRRVASASGAPPAARAGPGLDAAAASRDAGSDAAVPRGQDAGAAPREELARAVAAQAEKADAAMAGQAGAEATAPREETAGARVARPGAVEGWEVRAGDWWRWAVAVGVGVVLLVPLGLLGLGQTAQVDWIDSGWRTLGSLPGSLARSGVVAGILGGLGVLALVVAKADRVLAMLAVWAAAPPLVIFVAAPQFFYYRYLLFTLPAWTLLAALGAHAAVRGLERRRRLAAAFALCVAVLVLGMRDHQAVRRSPLAGDQDYRGAAGYLAGHQLAGDSVVFAGHDDKRERFGFAYELRGRQAPAECAQLSACRGRVWLVTSEPAPVPAGFTQLDERAFAGIQLRLLTS